MIIDRLEIHRVRIPLINPWVTVYGTEECVETVLIKAYAGDYQAWVETCPLKTPRYTPESAISVFHTISEIFGPLILGADFDSAREVSDRLNGFCGNSFAKAGVEQCWWALESVRRGIPLRRLFGGGNGTVSVACSIGIEDSMEALLQKIECATKQGARQIKLKIRPGQDLEIVRGVRNAYPDLTLAVDCNGGYALDDSTFFNELDQFGLEMIEQPLHCRELSEHAQLQDRLATAICLDESIMCLRDAERAISFKSCRMINIKIGRVGGLTTAIDIHDLCQENGVATKVGGMFESGIGTSWNIELATLPHFTGTNGITLPGMYLETDLVTPFAEFDGPFQLIPGAGEYLSRGVDEKAVDELTIAKVTIG